MERNAYAFVTQKLAAAWLAMRLDVMGLLILTGTGERREGGMRGSGTREEGAGRTGAMEKLTEC